MLDAAATPGAATWTGEARFLAALHHQQPDATPVWFMRQAGRALADYRALRERYSILTLAKTPELCAQVTLMPVHAFGVDAAVLFADIMLPLEPMGVSLEIQPDVGPIIHHPIRSAADVDRLRVIEPEAEVGFVMEAIRLVRAELDGRHAVIGFSGSPFTLACYLIEGRPSRPSPSALGVDEVDELPQQRRIALGQDAVTQVEDVARPIVCAAQHV